MSKGISLHIGLDRVNKNAYGGAWEGHLNHCIDDARAMQRIAQENNFADSSMLSNEGATREGVIDSIRRVSQQLNPGDLFLLTYAGHGTYVEDLVGDENDQKDETWCLYDGLLIDDEIHDLLGGFNNGVRILVVSDSCHSGTVVKADEELGEGFSQLITRDLPRGVRDIVVEEEKGRIQEVQEKKQNDFSSIGASVLLIAACQDKQKAYEGVEGHGILTKKLLDAWSQGTFRGNYSDFFQTIKNNMPRVQQPNFYSTGKQNEAFYNQSPFSI